MCETMPFSAQSTLDISHIPCHPRISTLDSTFVTQFGAEGHKIS